MIDRIRSAVRALTTRDQLRHELDEEMQFHIEQLAEDLMRQGVAPDAAHREARQRFGTSEHVHEGARRAQVDSVPRGVVPLEAQHGAGALLRQGRAGDQDHVALQEVGGEARGVEARRCDRARPRLVLRAQARQL